MKLNFAWTPAISLLTLGIGLAIGLKLHLPVETETDPPVSTRTIGGDMQRYLCAQSTALAALSERDHHTRKNLKIESLQARAYSDRGIICTVDGIFETVHIRGHDSFVSFKEKTHQMILVAITGESEIVSDEFVEALLKSSTVSAMSSNAGNDGTVRPKLP
ncbi:hypothetical protein GIW05_00115 [Pseudomonas syringae]|uniref:hypothetical protein n=1 Tax=Pseudomonas syringae TaxID=317 RepID=UPI001F313FD0|nr:hypothetical protein [Pseudomonas syringae]MCF5381925.1 hypothetical protein [Pseudomonas syringae]MCF5423821.1 hypothetical protein [Pseudomonas syringae]MCF5455012.1 hypothetical protein [Pseudomonas syringae]MCF5460858.1 hypothetical protein [Pseudomonas syringae]